MRPRKTVPAFFFRRRPEDFRHLPHRLHLAWTEDVAEKVYAEFPLKKAIDPKWEFVISYGSIGEACSILPSCICDDRKSMRIFRKHEKAQGVLGLVYASNNEKKRSKKE